MTARLLTIVVVSLAVVGWNVGWAVAQPESVEYIEPTFEIGLDFKPGSTIHFKTEKTRITKREGEPATKIQNAYPSTLKTVNIRGGKRVITWKPGEVEWIEPADPPPQVREMAKLVEDVPFELEWDRKEQDIVRLHNYDEVMKLFDSSMTAITENLVGEGMPESMVGTLREMTLAPFQNPETAHYFLLRDLLGFFVFDGRSLYEDAETIFTIQLPNPFGGEPIPATETWQPPEPIGETKTYRLQWEQVMDGDALVEALRPMVERLHPDDSRSQTQAMKEQVSGMQRTITGTAVYDARKKMITSAEIVQVTGDMDKAGRSESWMWTVTDDPEKGQERRRRRR